MSRKTILVLAFGFLMSGAAHAQYIGAHAGVGIWGGAQPCGNYRIPEGIRDVQDEIDEVSHQRKENKRAQEEAKEKLEELKDKLADYDRALEFWLKPTFREAVKQFATSRVMGGHDVNLNNDYICDSNGQLTQLGLERVPPAIANQYYCMEAISEELAKSLSTEEKEIIRGQHLWNAWVAPAAVQPGRIDGYELCRSNNAIRIEVQGLLDTQQSGLNRDLSKCANAVTNYSDILNQIKTVEGTIASLKLVEEDLKNSLDSLKKKKRRAIRDHQRDLEEGYYDYTEAGNCEDCGPYRNAPKMGLGDKLIGLAGVLGAAYLGYRGAKYAIDTAADLGWPTHWTIAPYLSGMMGAGFAAAGLYGYGYGGGGFACTPTPWGPGGMYGPGGLYGAGIFPNVGGAFGYPVGWGGALGGGLYMPGMGPWGVPGPWGGGWPIGVGGVPMAGFIVSAIGGGIAGIYSPYFGLYGPMGGIMMPMGGGMMMPGWTVPGWMMPIGGGVVGAIGTVMMPMGGGMMMPGWMMPGAIGMLFGPMSGGMMMPMGGGMMMPMGGMMMPMGGYSMQYQQMLMQMQLQQMNMWMQQVQQQQQDMMAREQMKMRIAMQIQQLYMQMEQISMGYYFNSGSTYPGGYPTGTVLPLPGQNPSLDPNLGPLPGRGRFGQ